MGNYLSPSELEKLTESILSDFPEIFKKIDVGMTYYNNEMPGFVLAKGLSDIGWNK